jgi:formylglycine-generating enzyme required for sulfatase activity
LSLLILVEPIGERPIEATDLPLTLGGPGAAVLLPGARPGEVLAQVGVEEGRLVVRGPAIGGGREAIALQAGGSIECGPARLSLDAAGDVPRLLVAHAASPNTTRPPVVEGQPLEVQAATADRVPFRPIEYSPPRAQRMVGRRAFRPGRWAAVAAGGALVALLGLLLVAAPITVETLPRVEPDSIEFAGVADVWVGDRHLVWPGHALLQVSAAGYRPASVEVDAVRGASQTVRVPLERLPGRITFDTGGIAATLSVDGAQAGTLPGEHELAAGTREIVVEAPRHEAFRTRLTVTGGGEAQVVQVALKPAFAGLSVESLPAGARVLVDGRELGVTPLQASLDAGRYRLAIAHPDYRTWEAPVTIRAGQPLKVGPIELGLPDGVVVLRTDPTGADVRVGGRYAGRTPAEISLAPGVAHELIVSRPGFGAIERSVQVAPRERKALTLALVPVFGEVVVRGQPADAGLWVDGESRGQAVQTLRLPAAPHVIEVRKAGLESFRSTVTPRPGLPQVVEFTLVTAEEAKAARVAALVRTSLGQELRLIRGGRFLMGSPRREPGRRSNETQRLVELRRPFYLATTEVTNGEYRQFQPKHMAGAYKQESLDLDRQPVAAVSWRDAAEFCNWLSVKDGLPPAYVERGGRLALATPAGTGYRLPTEAEWEFAARFDGAAPTRKYPWGNELPVPAASGNYGDRSAIFLGAVMLDGYDDGQRVSAPAGSFAPNPLGLADLGGNVAEWTTDFYTIYVVPPEQVAIDPAGPAEGDRHVVRGSSWLTGRVADLRLAWRDSGTNGRPDLGFRIARYAE